MERNEHAKLLLQQLISGRLESPYVAVPPPGLLQMPHSSSVNPLHNDPLESLLNTALSPSSLPPSHECSSSVNFTTPTSSHQSLQSSSSVLKTSDLVYLAKANVSKSHSDGFEQNLSYLSTKQKPNVTSNLDRRASDTDISHVYPAGHHKFKRHHDSSISPTKHTYVQTNIQTAVGSGDISPVRFPGLKWDESKQKTKQKDTRNKLNVSPLSVSSDLEPGSSFDDLLECPEQLPYSGSPNKTAAFSVS